jgi:hypothetical protein
VLRPGLVKGNWKAEVVPIILFVELSLSITTSSKKLQQLQEDKVILDCMASGVTKWSAIADKIPGRIGKQCRERWSNHLDPNLMKNDWTPEEDIELVCTRIAYHIAREVRMRLPHSLLLRFDQTCRSRCRMN